MELGGILPEDAPDSAMELVESLNPRPIPGMELIPQPALEDWDSVGLSYTEGNGGNGETMASISYRLWGNPDDRAYPVNLADLDETTRRSIEKVPP